MHVLVPEITSPQCVWQLIFRRKGNYWCRHLPDDFSKDIDSKIDNLIFLSTGVDLRVNTISAFAKEWCRLPVSKKGLRIRSLFDRCHSEIMGGAVQGIHLLVGRTNANGAVIKDRIQSLSLITWIGKTSFDVYNPDTWWRELMSKNTSATSNATSLSRLHMSRDYTSTCRRANLTIMKDSVFHNSPEHVDFNHDDNAMRGSVT